MAAETPTPPAPWTVPEGWKAGDLGACRSCRETVMWATTPAGRTAPINRDGVSHFATCPHANDWRNRRRA